MKVIYVNYLGVFKILKEDNSRLLSLKRQKNRVKKLIGLLILDREGGFTDKELVAKFGTK